MRTEMSRQKFEDIVTNSSLGHLDLVVPNMLSSELRIKIVSEEEFKVLHSSNKHRHLSHDSQTFLFGEEGRCLASTPGVMVSCWAKSSLVSKPSLTYDYASSILEVYDLGFGRRPRTDCVGLNLYVNRRESNRPNPSPLVSECSIQDHQYWRQTQTPLLVQPILEKRLHHLTHNARRIFQKLNPPMFDMFSDSCQKQIVTTGRQPNGNKYSLLAFANTSHVDKCDELTIEQTEDLLKVNSESVEPNHVKAFIPKLIRFEGFCLPTTCAYQFLFKNEPNGKIEQYFSLEGLGLAMELQHGIGHHFLGSSFAHRTCVCTRTFNNGDVSISKHNDDFLLFAWGRSGGLAEHDRNKKKARK